jgi:hypothetical protein
MNWSMSVASAKKVLSFIWAGTVAVPTSRPRRLPLVVRCGQTRSLSRLLILLSLSRCALIVPSPLFEGSNSALQPRRHILIAK